ncbi:carbonic anhydrase family protein [Noviherbaspirillum sp. L7-7A]|uniref:carbonic anhydrase n=1 Tax=Noviherbaspirillum sp. L7-7A TaxID=2850560 RepID=UPI001C2BBB68|nr:carbonic anhydrase family protein [Noviherbaspirillum sp. L7-7A]MBV0881443.1 carbonic anhydrase family protein [Noviherbaspirillum sp. L7-7A]
MSTTFAGNGAHWTYWGHAGAAHWAELEQDLLACKTGTNQSPINIEARKVKPGPLKPINFAYQDTDAEVVNNGHTIQVNLEQTGKTAFASSDYTPVQFHFHTPSEEKINGQTYPMVAHVVHKNAEGKLAVVAVLFKQGKHNAAMKTVFDNLPAKEGEVSKLDAPFNLDAMLPANRAYYKFTSSLTTPCSEDVSWHVLESPVEPSVAQIAVFRRLYAMNARPVQPLNGRVVELRK